MVAKRAVVLLVGEVKLEHLGSHGCGYLKGLGAERVV
jgi:hypothetical protein